MPESEFFERRSAPRFYARISILCINPANSRVYFAKTHEISAYGIRLIATEAIEPSTRLNLCINMPDNGEQINVRGDVVWSKKLNDDHYMVGVHLTDSTLKPIPLALRSIQASL
jgi:hypothetical protein